MVKDNLQATLSKFYKEFTTFRDGVETNMIEVKGVLAQHSRALSQHTHSLLNIEDTLKLYGDMYQINKEGIERIDGRVKILETKSI